MWVGGWLWVCPSTSDAVFPKPSRRLCPRHVGSSLQSGAGTVGSGVVSAEQCPQAGPATPLDDAGADLAPRRYRSAPQPHAHLPLCQRGACGLGRRVYAVAGARDLHPRLSLRGTAERGVPDPTEVWQSCSLGVEPQLCYLPTAAWAGGDSLPSQPRFPHPYGGSIASSPRVGEHSAWHTLVVKSKRPWERGQVS